MPRCDAAPPRASTANLGIRAARAPSLGVAPSRGRRALQDVAGIRAAAYRAPERAPAVRVAPARAARPYSPLPALPLLRSPWPASESSSIKRPPLRPRRAEPPTADRAVRRRPCPSRGELQLPADRKPNWTLLYLP
jgi:hypothetical protein